MHEIGIARSVLDIALREAAGRRVITIDVRIGEWSGVDTESLRFGFDCLKVDLCPDAALRVERASADELDVTGVEVEES